MTGPALDPKAIAADPTGYAKWRQQASQAGYQYGAQGQNQGQTPPSTAQPNVGNNYGGQGRGYGSPMGGQPTYDPFGSQQQVQTGQAKPTTQPQPYPGQSAPSQYGYANSSTIQPGQDLRNQQILPQNSQRTQTTQGQVNNAANAVYSGGYSPYSAYQQQSAPYTANASQYQGQAAGALGQTGYGQYGSINPTITGAQQISGPQYNTGAYRAPTQTAGPFGGAQNLQYGGDTSGSRSAVNSAASGLQGPDRTQLASDAYKLLLEQEQPGFDQNVRSLGESAAAFGRQGSGLVNNQLADLGTAKATADAQQARGLATDAASQSLADRQAVLSGNQSVLGQLSGLDTTQNSVANQNALNTYDRNFNLSQANQSNALNAYNANLSRDQAYNSQSLQAQGQNASNTLQAQNAQYNQQADNRNFALTADQARNNLGLAQATQYGSLGNQAFNQGQAQQQNFGNYETNQANYNTGRLNQLSGLEQQQFGQDQSNYGSLLGERNYQNQLSQQATNNAINQYQTEQGAQNNDWQQQVQDAGVSGGLGFGSDPYGALTNAAGQYGQQSQQSAGAAGDFLGQYLGYQQNQPQYGPIPMSNGAYNPYVQGQGVGAYNPYNVNQPIAGTALPTSRPTNYAQAPW